MTINAVGSAVQVNDVQVLPERALRVAVVCPREEAFIQVILHCDTFLLLRRVVLASPDADAEVRWTILAASTVPLVSATGPMCHARVCVCVWMACVCCL